MVFWSTASTTEIFHRQGVLCYIKGYIQGLGIKTTGYQCFDSERTLVLCRARCWTCCVTAIQASAGCSTIRSSTVVIPHASSLWASHAALRLQRLRSLLRCTLDTLCTAINFFISISVRVHRIDGILVSSCMPDEACSHVHWAVQN